MGADLAGGRSDAGRLRRRLAAYAHDIERGLAFPFLVFRHSDGALVGGITLSNIRRGVAQMGTIGYWVGEPYTRRGYTLEAVRARQPLLLRAPGSASPGGCLHPLERGLARRAGERRLRAGGNGPRLSEN